MKLYIVDMFNIINEVSNDNWLENIDYFDLNIMYNKSSSDDNF